MPAPISITADVRQWSPWEYKQEQTIATGKPYYPFFLINGKKKLGKTVLTKSLIQPWATDQILVFFGTDRANHDYSGQCEHCHEGTGTREDRDYHNHTCTVPVGAIHNKFDGNMLRAVWNKQMDLVEDVGIEHAPGLVIVIDDMTDQVSEINACETMIKIATMGRHYKTMLVVVMHHIFALDIKIRGLADVVFALAQTNQRFVRGMQDEFLSDIGTVEMVKAMIKALTKKYGVLVYIPGNGDLSNSLFKYRANPKCTMLMGSKRFRRRIISRQLSYLEQRLIEREKRRAQTVSSSLQGMSRINLQVRVSDRDGRIIEESSNV